MSFKCPHCQAAIADVLTQDEHVKRLKAKDDLNKTLTDQLKATQESAAKVPTLETEREELAGKLRGMERGMALANAGIRDEKVRRTIEVVYDAEMSGRAPEEVVPFSEFEKWAGDHPLLASAFKPPAPGPVVTPKPPATPGAAPAPAPGPRMTEAQLNAYFDSPEWKSLPIAERRAKLPELQRQVRGA